MKKIFKSIFLFLGISSLSSQEITAYKDGVIKFTYNKGNTRSSEYDTDAYLYANEHQSEYHFHQTERTFPVEWYEVTLAYKNHINSYNFNTKKVEENRILKDNTTLYAQWENDLVWEITDEEKVIGGFKARKAIADSFEIEKDDQWYSGKAIAWFATELPIPSGPGRYYGLPGLILELSYERGRDRYKFKKLEYISTSDYNFVELDKKNKVKEREDVIWGNHKNPKKIKEIQRNNRKKK